MHVAAKYGNVGVMELLVAHFPALLNMKNSTGEERMEMEEEEERGGREEERKSKELLAHFPALFKMTNGTSEKRRGRKG